MQVPPQSIDGDAGDVEATVPVPAPAFTTERAKLPGGENAAVTLRAWSIVTTQVPVPVQAPDQPAKVELPVGVATRVTLVPAATLAEHVEPQSMVPGGELEATVPTPVPAFDTERR